MFKLQKKALQIITGVSNRTSCRQIPLPHIAQGMCNYSLLLYIIVE
jgi:hypothetical protein